MSSTTSFLHKTTVHRRLAAGNRAHIFFHFLLILSIFYYRFSSYIDNFSTHAWTCMIIAEVILALAWFFSQSFRWRPLTRNVFPENLSGDIDFPGLDVFVCTADPIKEPTLDVMNTVISAMSLDYPAEKLAVYLSDDGGAAVTLQGMREAAAFARWWVPFCKKHDVKTRAPGAYFSGLSDGDEGEHGGEFRDEVKEIKSKYEIFKKRVEGAGDVAHVDDINSISGNGRAPVVQVINDNRGSTDENDIKMPLLVYVSRERRPSYPHRFKAGALNALLRVSGILSNGPYIMVLDCDMFCNDPASAKQAMCLHLDPKMSSELSFVQFPQMFYNVTKNDIYDGQTRSAFKTKWQGMDGLMGPVLTGSGYYLKKKALYGSPDQEDAHLHQPDASRFGHSNLFIASIIGATDKIDASTKELLREAHLLASCSFEKGTKWGSETKWQGMDGLMGPVLTGSGYYLKKKALYGSPDQEDAHLHQPDASSFGHSNLFIASISGATDKIDASTEELLREAYLLASCSFEKGTKWDSEIGYSYECLLESTFTGYFLQCKGWTSMYLYPEKPAFLGCAAIDMKDGLIQLRKWNGSLLELGFSKFSPLSYAISSRMTFLHSMCYAYFSFQPLLAFSFLIYGLVPQFCFAKGIPVFPKANETWFKVFLALWISSHLQHMYEVFTSGGTLRTWWNEQRIWVIKVVSGSLFGCIDCLMKMLGISTTVFRLTNKAIAKEKVENYEKGKFDFEGAQVFMVPMVALVIWNLVCFIGGIWSIIGKGNVSDMFGQLLLSTFLVVVSYPVIEGIVTKKSRGKSE